MFDRLWPYFAALGTGLVFASQAFGQGAAGSQDGSSQGRLAKLLSSLFFGGDTLAQWIIAVTGVVAISVAIWAVVVLRRSLNATRIAVEEARQSTKAAERTADAARKQADLAEASMLRLERPYLFLEISETHYLRSPGSDRPFLRCFFVNHGRTPAVLQSISLQLIDDSQGSLRLPLDVTTKTYEVIRPGAHTEIRVVPVEGSAKGRKWGEDEATKLVLLGVAVYQDGAGYEHTDSFCLRASYGADNFVVEGGTEYNKRTTTRPVDRNSGPA